MKKQQIIIIIVFIGIVLLFIFLNTVHCFSDRCPWERPSINPPLPKVVLTFVGPWDSPTNWAGIIAKFEQYKKSAGIDVIVQYKTMSDKLNYENNIQEMRIEDDGPNIYTIFHNWIPRYTSKLLPMPVGMMSLKEYKDTYAAVAYDDLVVGKSVYALPFYIDTPILFYNQDKFLNEGYLRPPETWEEFKDYTEALTIYDKQGETFNDTTSTTDMNQPIVEEKKIKVAGAAIGGGSNVNRSQDILMLMIMQNNLEKNYNSLVSFQNPGTYTAIKAYTDFTDPSKRFYTWNENQMLSNDAFAQRKAAMMINYSYNIAGIKNQTDGTLNFKVAPVPQADKNFKANYASYWVPVVPKSAPCRAAVKVDCYKLAWEFLYFAAQKGNVELYLDSTNKAAANLQIAQTQANNFDDMRSASASQVLTAKSWSRPDERKSDEVLEEMIDAIVTKDKDQKLDIKEAMQEATDKIVQLN